MELMIEGRRAVVKPGTSVEYVLENRAFTRSDGYTLTIELPLRGCQENKDIFGHLNRVDVERDVVRLDAVLMCGARLCRRGVVTVVSATDELVKCQFLEGRSAQNFDTTLDDVYVNELDLGMDEIALPSGSVHGWVRYGSVERTDFVCLPWVNASSGNLQNDVELSTDVLKAKKLSAMPYLVRLTGWILRAAGYDYDLSEWLSGRHRHLVCCNVLPASWESKNWADALPHWSVSEWLEQLERLLGGWFDVDGVARRVVFRYAREYNAGLAETRIDDVSDEFEVETSEKDGSGLEDAKVYKYADRDDDEWQFLSCRDVVDGYRGHYYEFALWHDFFRGFLNGKWSSRGDLRNYTPGIGSGEAEEVYGRLFRVAELDTFFGMRCVGTVETTALTTEGEKVKVNVNKAQMLNVYGDVGDEGGEEVELKVVPVRVDWTDKGFAVFVPVSGDGGATDVDGIKDDYGASPAGGRAGFGRKRNRFSDDFDAGWRSGGPVRAVLEEDDGGTEYFSQLYVAYWDGQDYQHLHNSGHLACPVVDKVTFYDEGDDVEAVLWKPEFSLRLSERELQYGSVVVDGERRPAVDVRSKYVFTFLSDVVPEVRSVFRIRGQRFVCAKVTVGLGDDGMSRLMKGEFYRLLS